MGYSYFNNQYILNSNESSDSDESDYNSDEETIIDNIFDEETDFLDSDKINNNYYIGNYFYDKQNNTLLMGSVIRNKTFFNYDINYISLYLRQTSCIENVYPEVEIVKLNLIDGKLYSVILKTYWLSIIQRHWKKTYSNHRNMNMIPKIKGLLNMYNNNTKIILSQ